MTSKCCARCGICAKKSQEKRHRRAKARSSAHVLSAGSKAMHLRHRPCHPCGKNLSLTCLDPTSGSGTRSSLTASTSSRRIACSNPLETATSAALVSKKRILLFITQTPDIAYFRPSPALKWRSEGRPLDDRESAPRESELMRAWLSPCQERERIETPRQE